MRFGAVRNGVSSPFDGASRCVVFVQYPAGWGKGCEEILEWCLVRWLTLGVGEAEIGV